jgi:hypothetical protein
MTVRFHVTFVACFASLLGGTPRLAAQVDLFIAHVADGGGFFTQVSVHNPGINTAACTFSTFDGQGNPLDLVYDATPADSTASVHHRSRAIPAATAVPASSVQFNVDPLGTFTTETAGVGDGKGNVLQGGAELSCNNTVIGGATYWLTSSEGEFVTGIGVPAASPTTFFRAVGGNENTAFAVYNLSTDIGGVTVEAFDDTGANSYGPVTLEIDPNGHYAFNANTVLTTLPSGFSGSFRLNSGQQFVAVALGVQSTTANEAGYVLYTIPSLSGKIAGIDQEQIRK